MTDVRLEVLCDVVSLSGHSVDSSLYVGDVWYGCGWWWWRWRWLLHGGTEWMFVMWLALPRVGVVVCVKGWLREVGSEGRLRALESALDAACAKPWRPVTLFKQMRKFTGRKVSRLVWAGHVI